MKKDRKLGSGGAREGSGHPLKYGEKTVNATFRVPKSKKQEFREYVNKKLKSWQNKNK